MPAATGPDPFTAEIIKAALLAATQEMFITTARTSKSSVIYEVLDYACGLTDADGRLIAQANGVPGFSGSLTFAVREVLGKHGKEGLAEGDIVISNIPYSGAGTHTSDVVLTAPIFYRGELVAFASNKAHWTEVGGKDPGSWTTDSTEIYQEGLLFPAVKLFERGRPNQALLDLIEANVRLPDMTLGDMNAQAASLRVAARRVPEICDKYGLDTVLRAVEAYMDYGEELALRALRQLPKGTFEGHDYIDDDGLSDDPIYVSVKVTVTDDEFVVDFTGSSGQSRGPINSTLPSTLCAVRSIYHAVTDPHAHVNEGCFRPLRVIVPEGCIFHATKPAPTSTYWESMLYGWDLVWHVLAPHLPHRLTAGHFLSVCATIVGGVYPGTNRPFILVEPQAGGWGAGHDKDGESALVCCGDGETYIIPVEICETRYPILVDQFALNLATGGAGKFRGGFGLIRDYRITSDSAFLTASFGRNKFPPWGVCGGRQGTPNRVRILKKNGEVFDRAKMARLPLERDDVARLITGVGGGYGDPLERDPRRVLSDVLNEYIASDDARQVYGVVIDGLTWTVDAGATARLRRQMARATR